MKRIPLILLVLALSITSIFVSCERDDICSESTATTPNLILTFYDLSDQDALKSVTGLRAFGIDDMDQLISIPGVTGSNTDSIALPLRTNANETRFVLCRACEIDDNGTTDTSDDTITGGNPDTITISYEREDIYVSRACGFKTIFNNIGFSIEEETDDPDDDLGNWMSQFIIEAPNNSITNEATAHINIFH